MKQKLAYGLLVVVIAAAVGWSWYTWSGEGAQQGFPLVCPHCGHFFTLSEEQVRTWPRSPTGQGLECAKCRKFGAGAAVRCEKCGEWYLPEGTRGSSGECPHCGWKPGSSP